MYVVKACTARFRHEQGEGEVPARFLIHKTSHAFGGLRDLGTRCYQCQGLVGSHPTGLLI